MGLRLCLLHACCVVARLACCRSVLLAFCCCVVLCCSLVVLSLLAVLLRYWFTNTPSSRSITPTTIEVPEEKMIFLRQCRLIGTQLEYLLLHFVVRGLGRGSRPCFLVIEISCCRRQRNRDTKVHRNDEDRYTCPRSFPVGDQQRRRRFCRPAGVWRCRDEWLDDEDCFYY